MPSQFSSPVFAVNFAVSANHLAGDLFFFRNYVQPQLKKLKVVVASIDLDMWGTSKADIFESEYVHYPGHVYDRNHVFWKNGYPEDLFLRTYNSPGPLAMAVELRPTRGFSPQQPGSWGEPVVSEDSCWMDRKPHEYRKNFEMLKDLIGICQKDGIFIIGVVPPQNPRYKETGAFGKHGLRRSEILVLMKEISALADTYPNFILLDENKLGNHDYLDEMAQDTDHLSVLGAERLTRRIDSLIQTLDIDFCEWRR